MKNKPTLKNSLTLLLITMLIPIMILIGVIILETKKKYNRDMDALVERSLNAPYQPIIVLRDDSLAMYPQEEVGAHIKHTRRYIEVEEDGEGKILSYKDVSSPKTIE